MPLAHDPKRRFQAEICTTVGWGRTNCKCSLPIYFILQLRRQNTYNGQKCTSKQSHNGNASFFKGILIFTKENREINLVFSLHFGLTSMSKIHVYSWYFSEWLLEYMHSLTVVFLWVASWVYALINCGISLSGFLSICIH